MGSAGALPVRQALHSFIASSCEKPPETKEEARAALEVMFQVRAEKIRRAIEQGKLATTEALKHKVIHRRKSLAIGEARRNSASASCSTPGFMGPSIGNKSSARFSQEPYSRDQHGVVAQRSMSVDRPSTFGLSDDEVMTSFTTFTDRFSDSLLSRSGASESHGGDEGSSQSPHQRQDWIHAASLSPFSLEKSPVTPDDLLSRPAWTPLMPYMSYPAAAQQLPMVAPMSSQEPQHGLPISQSPTFAKGDIAAHSFLSQAPAAQEVVGLDGPLRHDDQATAAWNHYVKYLMCSQEPWDQPSLPEQQSQDPQWQAAMMAMMMDPS
ncbi:hypothetical protein BGZ70_007876 [Mortierella alpina]|uniref:Uncharacterized protein n=1 Tax=Mortierella alpina TaxID=64518 RepID=A0A9P6J734_MORAP|nr:hypothetical protein BGZ70_007876 [Mortierella alpina]